MTKSEKSKQITLNDLNRLSIDEDNNLYWDEKPLVTEKKVSLSNVERFVGGIVALVTVLSLSATGIKDFKELNEKKEESSKNIIINDNICLQLSATEPPTNKTCTKRKISKQINEVQSK